MVAHLIRLKWQLLRNGLKRSAWQIVGIVFGVLYGAGIVGMLIVGLVSLRGEDDAGAVRTGLVLGGSVVLLGWILLPLLSFGNDPTLDPARFATYAIPLRQFVVGLTLAALVGLPGLASALILLASVATWSRSPLGLGVALVGAVLALLTMVAAGRLATTALSKVMQSRRGRDVTTVVTLLLLISIGPLVSTVSAGSLDAGLAKLTTLADVVAWTPLGWAFAAPGDVALGHTFVALLRLGLAAALLVVILALWSSMLQDAVQNPRAAGGERITVHGDGLGLFARFPGTPTGAIGARMLTYWRRDPRYLAGAAMTPLVPLFLLIPHLTAAPSNSELLLLMAPLGCYLLGWSEHNNIAYDATAFWLHAVSGVSGRADRLGRLVPSLLFLPVMSIGYCLLSCALTTRWDLFPGLFGLSIGLAGAGYGMSMVASVIKPYPVPGPGDSPFATPSGAAGITIAVQSVAGLVSMALGIPLYALAWLAWDGVRWAPWALLLAGVALGAAYFVAGLRVGARRYEAHTPELLADLSGMR